MHASLRRRLCAAVLAGATTVAAGAEPAAEAPPPPSAQAGTAAAAETGTPQDLLTVYQRALRYDPRFRSAEATYRADRQKLPQARALLLPNISATAARNRVDTDRKVSGALTFLPSNQVTYNRSDYTLSVTQPIFNGSAFAAFREAKAQVRQAEATFAASKQDLILRVAEAYLGVLLAKDSLDLAEAQKKALQRALEVAQGRLEVGLATITDVHDARARFEVAAAQEIEAQNTLEDARQALREVTGEPPGRLYRLAETIPLVTPDPPDVRRWVDIAIKQNLALLAQQAATDTAREEVSRVRAGHYPTLDLVGNRSYDKSDASISGPGVRTDTTEYGVQLNVPLFQGGLIMAQTTEAVQRYSAAQQNYEAQRRSTERTARLSFLSVSSAKARVTALKQSVIAGESALEAKQEGYEAGINTILDVLDAERDLYQAKRDYSDARHNYVLNLLRLKQAAGTLTEDDLVQVNRWLEVAGIDSTTPAPSSP